MSRLLFAVILFGAHLFVWATDLPQDQIDFDGKNQHGINCPGSKIGWQLDGFMNSAGLPIEIDGELARLFRSLQGVASKPEARLTIFNDFYLEHFRDFTFENPYWMFYPLTDSLLENRDLRNILKRNGRPKPDFFHPFLVFRNLLEDEEVHLFRRFFQTFLASAHKHFQSIHQEVITLKKKPNDSRQKGRVSWLILNLLLVADFLPLEEQSNWKSELKAIYPILDQRHDFVEVPGVKEWFFDRHGRQHLAMTCFQSENNLNFYAPVFSKNAKYLMAKTSGSVDLFHLEKKPLLRRPFFNFDKVSSPVFSPNDLYFALGLPFDSIKLYNLGDDPGLENKPTEYIAQIGGWVPPRFSSNEKYLVYLDESDIDSYETDAKMVLFDLETEPELQDPTSIYEFKHGVFAPPVFSPDERYIATVSHDGIVFIFDLMQDPKIMNPRQIRVYSRVMFQPVFSPVDQIVIWVDFKEKIQVLDLDNSKTEDPQLSIDLDSQPLTTPKFSPDGKYLVYASKNFHLHVLDFSEYPNVREVGRYFLNDKLSDPPVFSADGRFLAAAGSQKNIYIFDLKKDPMLHEPTVLHTESGFVSQPAFSVDGQRLAVGGIDGYLYLMTLNDGLTDPTTLLKYYAEERIVYSPQFSPDGRFLATASAGKHIFLFDLEGGLTWQHQP